MSTLPGIWSFGGNERSPEVPDSQGWPVHWQVSLPDLSSRLKYLIFSLYRLPAAHTCFNQLDLPAYEVRNGGKHPRNITHFHPFRLMTNSEAICWRPFRSALKDLDLREVWGAATRKSEIFRLFPTRVLKYQQSSFRSCWDKNSCDFWLLKWLKSGPAEVTNLCQVFITIKAFV